VSGRDEMITLLARSDAGAADRLANTYVAYQDATGTLTTQELSND
jgi:hypothetical protein